MEYALEIRNLRKSYPGFTLRDVTWRVPAGYISGLIGPNGAGKTTLIKLVMNLIRKEAGEIRVFGLDHIRAERRIKERVGFVYDGPLPYDYLRPRAFKAIVASFYEKWDEEAFRRISSEFALPLNKSIRKLSRGMRMKFAICLALSHGADFIIMDEPTSGLDPVFRRELLDKLAGILQDEGKTILFSTHVTPDLERIADFVTFIKDGAVVFSESKDALLERWAVVKGGNELLAPDAAGLLAGYRKGRFHVEGITSDAVKARRLLGEGIVVEKPSLEDIFRSRRRR